MGFSQVIKQIGLSNHWFTIHSHPNSLGHARLGITVSKRIVSSSVQRNKIKRCIRECFRSQKQRVVPKDVVIRLRKFVVKQELSKASAVLGESLRLVLANI